MIWNKLQKKHLFLEPVEHIHITNIIDAAEYDRLYENQNNLNHHVWQEFDEKYRLGFEFKEDITQINFNKEVIALWFFKERSDLKTQDINIAGKLISYSPNAILLTKSKDITIKDNNKKYIRRPFVQLDISKTKFEKMCERLTSV